MDVTNRLPKSATSFRINLIGLVSLLGGMYAVHTMGPVSGEPASALTHRMLILLATWSIPIVVLEAIFLRRLGPLRRERISLNRALQRAIGLYVTLFVCGALYWILPEYHGDFYGPYWRLLETLAPWVLLGCVPYFLVTEGFCTPTDNDAYLAIGGVFFGETRPDSAQLTQHALGWLVKFFFLPLMTVYMSRTTGYLGSINVDQIGAGFTAFYDFAWEIIFAVDLIVVTAGYLLALRLLDSHIRSTEPTVKGWLVAIICYQPFWSAISVGYLAYNKDNYNWGTWLAGNEFMTMLWGSLILLLITVYSLSSVAFGIRFSNLTHRGIITTGPYRYSKHPAYLSKNLSWWFISIPFISTTGDWQLVVQSCVMLLGLNGIYYLRAKTEEEHLARDPVYRSYQQYFASRRASVKRRVFRRLRAKP